MAVISSNRAHRAERVLVCGGRDYDDAAHVERVLNALHEAGPIRCIIEGGASGADDLARLWAIGRSVPHITFYADWREEGRSAGPKRNQRMLVEGKPDLVVAFPGGRGTADMLSRAKAAGVDWMQCAKDRSPEGENSRSEVEREAREPGPKDAPE